MIRIARKRFVLLALILGFAWSEALAQAPSFQTIFTFTDVIKQGSSPNGALLNVGGELFGTTQQGGLNFISGGGTLFQVTTAGAQSLVYSFGSRSPVLDGSSPNSGLVNVGGVLLGTTSRGGASDQGTIFGIDPVTGTQTVLFSFAGGAGGGSPRSGLINVGGALYGVTRDGGAANKGVLFRIKPDGTKYTVLRSFGVDSDDGAFPTAKLLNVNGTLYGTTAFAGLFGTCSNGCGTVFSYVIATRAYTTLHRFTGGAGGGRPVAELINVKGTLYTTTSEQGASGKGTIFRINADGTNPSVVYSFAGGSDGAGPLGALLNVGGKLWGTTNLGGNGNPAACFTGCGTVFRFNPATGTTTIIHAFTGTNEGTGPAGALINVGGSLYGTTSSGATIFRVTP